MDFLIIGTLHTLYCFQCRLLQCSAVCRAGTSCRLYRQLQSTEAETARSIVSVSDAASRVGDALDLQVYLGEQYVNNLTLSDVTFLVEGQTFHAHRIALLASSDTFRAMFDGHYKEKEASTIPIPNIRYCVFESMMRCIYTGDRPPVNCARNAAVASLAALVASLVQQICWQAIRFAQEVQTGSHSMFALLGSSQCAKALLQAHMSAAVASSHAT